MARSWMKKGICGVVIAAMLVAARNIYPGIKWVNEQAQDPAVTDISKTVETGQIRSIVFDR